MDLEISKVGGQEPVADLTQLAVQSLAIQAMDAYEQKQTRECISLIRQVLELNPDHEETLALKALAYAEIDGHLADARRLLETSRTSDEGGKSWQAAEKLLVKVLFLDAKHSDARDLLTQIRLTTSASPKTKAVLELQSETSGTSVSSLASDAGGPAPTSVPHAAQPTSARRSEPISFTARPAPVPLPRKQRTPIVTARNLMVVLAAVGALAGSLLVAKTYGAGSSAGTAEYAAASVLIPMPTLPTRAGSSSGASKPDSNVAQSATASDSMTPSTTTGVSAETSRLAAAVGAPAGTATQDSRPTPQPATEPGFLAVSSPIAADVFIGGRLIGSTPATFQLLPGRHTVEYRHDDLVATMIHEVRSKETVAVRVTFETTVQINARPWAQVFLEGPSRRSLGQTPLGSVRVPVGSLLTFENPDFPSKSYRVAGEDTAIQVAFQ